MTHAPHCGALARDLCDCAPCAPVPRTPGTRDWFGGRVARRHTCAPQRGRARVSTVERAGALGSNPRTERALDWAARTFGSCRKLAAVTCAP